MFRDKDTTPLYSKMATVTQFSDFSADGIKFSDVHKNKYGGKAVYLNTSDGRKLLVQLPAARAPFGLSPYEDAKTKQVTYTVPLSLDDPNIQDVFKQVDAKVLQFVADNSEALLGKKMSLEILSELYSPIIRPSKGDYAPQIKLKVLTSRDGTFLPKAYDHERNPVPLDSLGKGTTVQTIVDLNQIWVVDKKFGVTIRLEQLLMAPSAALEECAFDAE
jgi:Family of unknown function (DUF5871)